MSRIGNSIEYFKEAIQYGDDYLAMYNLAHIYIYNKSFEHEFDKSVELLIRSSKKFHHSLILLCLVLIKKFGINRDAIKGQIDKLSYKTSNIYSQVFETIKKMQLDKKAIFESLYESYQTKDFLYNIQRKAYLSSDLQNIKFCEDMPKNKKVKNISSLFYEGFGIKL